MQTKQHAVLSDWFSLLHSQKGVYTSCFFRFLGTRRPEVPKTEDPIDERNDDG